MFWDSINNKYYNLFSKGDLPRLRSAIIHRTRNSSIVDLGRPWHYGVSICFFGSQVFSLILLWSLWWRSRHFYRFFVFHHETNLNENNEHTFLLTTSEVRHVACNHKFPHPGTSLSAPLRDLYFLSRFEKLSEINSYKQHGGLNFEQKNNNLSFDGHCSVLENFSTEQSNWKLISSGKAFDRCQSVYVTEVT